MDGNGDGVAREGGRGEAVRLREGGKGEAVRLRERVRVWVVGGKEGNAFRGR